MRAALGPDYEIMTDANQGFPLDEAIRRAGRLAKLDLAWIEEPLPADDLDGHVRLSRATATPIAVGESIYSIRHFRDYMAKGACSIVQVDVARIGGVTPWLKVAHAAEAFDMPVCPHFLMELHVSLACAVPNGKYVEYIPQLDELTTSRLAIENGMALAPSAPGIGVEWDFDVVKAKSIPSSTDHRRRRAETDGHGDRRQAGADRRAQAHACGGLAGGPRQDLRLQHPATIRFSCASRRTCCSAISSITADVGRPMAPGRPPRAHPSLVGDPRADALPLETRNKGDRWATTEEVFHHD